MTIIDADKFLAYLIFSKHIDGLNCGEVKKEIEMCKVDVLDKIRAENSVKTDGDLISRDYVLSKFKEQCDRCGKYKENNGVMCRCCALDDAIDYVEDAPSAEKTAEWILKDGIYGVAYCSKCDYELHTDDTNYCPNCGAKMKEVEE